MDDNRLGIDIKLVRNLVAAQFPCYSNLPITPVKSSGWDNATFHLGDHMIIRMPQAACYAGQIDKERTWLPFLATQLPCLIPSPIAYGAASDIYPFRWVIYRWIEGKSLALSKNIDQDRVVDSLSAFFKALWSIDGSRGPRPGLDNFYRGGALEVYDSQVQQALDYLDASIDTHTLRMMWNDVLKSKPQSSAVWVHGDVSPGNIILRDGIVTAVIDWGLLAIGDPACDIAGALLLLDPKHQIALEKRLAIDDALLLRAYGWIVWKALIIAAGLCTTNACEWRDPLAILDQASNWYKKRESFL